MPSVKNPNKPSRNRVAARAATRRKQQRKQSAEGQALRGQDRMSKTDTKRGARPGLLPTSGPRAPLSAKKQKKVIQRMALALKRQMAANGGQLPGVDSVTADGNEVDMADAEATEIVQITQAKESETATSAVA